MPGDEGGSPGSLSESTEWIIVVARDQVELFHHLAQAFAGDDKVEIVLDRRKNYRRNPPGIEERLRIRGATVVKPAHRESTRPDAD